VEKDKEADNEKSLPLEFEMSAGIKTDKSGEPVLDANNQPMKIANAYGNGKEFFLLQKMPIAKTLARYIDFMIRQQVKTKKDVVNLLGLLENNTHEINIRNQLLKDYNEFGIKRIGQLAAMAEEGGFFNTQTKNYYVKLRLIEKGKIDYIEDKKTVMPKGEFVTQLQPAEKINYIPAVKDNNKINERVSNKTEDKLMNLMGTYNQATPFGDEAENLYTFDSFFARTNNGNKEFSKDAVLSEDALEALIAMLEKAVAAGILDNKKAKTVDIEERTKDEKVTYEPAFKPNIENLPSQYMGERQEIKTKIPGAAAEEPRLTDEGIEIAPKNIDIKPGINRPEPIQPEAEPLGMNEFLNGVYSTELGDEQETPDLTEDDIAQAQKDEEDDL